MQIAIQRDYDLSSLNLEMPLEQIAAMGVRSLRLSCLVRGEVQSFGVFVLVFALSRKSPLLVKQNDKHFAYLTCAYFISIFYTSQHINANPNIAATSSQIFFDNGGIFELRCTVRQQWRLTYITYISSRAPIIVNSVIHDLTCACTDLNTTNSRDRSSVRSTRSHQSHMSDVMIRSYVA